MSATNKNHDALINRIDDAMNRGISALSPELGYILSDCCAEIERLTLALKDSQALNLKFAQDREAADAEIERLMKVTQQEIVEALRSDLYRQNLEIARRIESHGIAPPVGWLLVPVQDCPDCDNEGQYWGAYGIPVQCQWCDQMPNSRFNYKKSQSAAPEVKP